MFKKLLSSRIIKNIGYLTAGRAINKLFFIVLFIVISRVLGVEGIGAYGFVFAFTGLIFPFSHIGVYIFVRDLIINKNSINKLWGNFLILKFLSNLIVYAVLIIITLVYPVHGEIKYAIYLTGLILFWSIFSEPAEAIFVSQQKIKTVALTDIAKGLLTVSFSVFFILLGKGISWIIVSFAIGEFVGAVMLNFMVIKRFSKPDLKIDVKLCIRWVKGGFYFTMQDLFNHGLFRIDILIISLMSGLYATGLYEAPYKIAVNIDFIPFLFLTIFYPYYININKLSFKKLKAHYTRHKLYVTIAGMVLCLFFFIFSKQIILLLFGEKFLESVLIFRILIISTLFLMLNKHNEALLNAVKKERVVFYMLFFIFLLNLLLDIILIKLYGIIGVALSTVACYVVFFIITEIYIKKVIKVKTFAKAD